jgi:hypothetical protein
MSPQRQRITEAKAARIQRDMTFDAVVSVLGCPPGDYRTGEVELDWSTQSTALEDAVEADHGQFRHRYWEGDEGNLWVCFDGDDRVVVSEFTRGVRTHPDILARLRHWLGR